MSDQGHSKPIVEFRAGTIVAAIWSADATRNGNSVRQHSIRIQKRYKDDKSGQWKTTTYVRPDELPKLALVASKAYEYVMLRQVDGTAMAHAR